MRTEVCVRDRSDRYEEAVLLSGSEDGMPVTSRSWKRPENRFSRRNSALLIP